MQVSDMAHRFGPGALRSCSSCFALHTLIYLSFRVPLKHSPVLPARHCSVALPDGTLPFGPAPAPPSEPSFLCWAPPLFVCRVSECDFVGVFVNIHARWAFSGKYHSSKGALLSLVYCYSYLSPNGPSETYILLWSQNHNIVLGKAVRRGVGDQVVSLTQRPCPLIKLLLEKINKISSVERQMTQIQLKWLSLPGSLNSLKVSFTRGKWITMGALGSSGSENT